MELESYQRAVRLMEKHPELMRFVGARSENLVKAAEEKLALTFPPSYRRFLLEYGAGSFGASEFYGVIDEKFENSSIPNGIWCTLQERRLGSLPLGLIIVSSDGAGGYFCIDCSAELAEAPIVTYHMGYPPHRQGKETVATSFGKFCLDLVRRELEP